MYYPTIYRTVKASERLPEKEDTYYTQWNGEWDDNEYIQVLGSNLFDGKEFDAGINMLQPDEWLEPLTNRYVFSEAELKQLLLKFDNFAWHENERETGIETNDVITNFLKSHQQNKIQQPSKMNFL